MCTLYIIHTCTYYMYSKISITIEERPKVYYIVIFVGLLCYGHLKISATLYVHSPCSSSTDYLDIPVHTLYSSLTSLLSFFAYKTLTKTPTQAVMSMMSASILTGWMIL